MSAWAGPTRLAVTGAGGFIGRAVCEAALDAGHEVVGIGPGAPPIDPRLRHVPGLIRGTAGLAPLLAGVSVLIHAAGRGTLASVTGLSSPAAQAELLLAGCVLDAASVAGVGKVVLISSGGTIYGEPDRPGPIGERHPIAPVSPYGAVKAAIEQMGFAVDRASRVEVVAARMSNPYGPGQLGRRGQGLVAAVFDRLQRGESVELWGDGRTVRDYVYITDAARGLLAASALPGGAVCHVSSGAGVETNTVVADIAVVMGMDARIVRRADRDPGVSRNVLSPALLAERTGWRAEVGWREGLARTAAWWGALAGVEQGARRL